MTLTRDRALEDIASWRMFEAEKAGDQTSGTAIDNMNDTATCPACGYTGQMDKPVGTMTPPVSTAAKARFESTKAAQVFDSYETLRDALSHAVREKFQRPASDATSDYHYVYMADFGDDWLIFSDSDDDQYFKVSYTLDDSGITVMDDKRQVQRSWIWV